MGRKKRGAVLMILSLLLLLAIVVKMIGITNSYITPELMMNFSLGAFLSAYKNIRHEVYRETIVPIISFLAVWLTGIVDVLFVGNGRN